MSRSRHQRLDAPRRWPRRGGRGGSSGCPCAPATRAASRLAARTAPARAVMSARVEGHLQPLARRHLQARHRHAAKRGGALPDGGLVKEARGALLLDSQVSSPLRPSSAPSRQRPAAARPSGRWSRSRRAARRSPAARSRRQPGGRGKEAGGLSQEEGSPPAVLRQPAVVYDRLEEDRMRSFPKDFALGVVDGQLPDRRRLARGRPRRQHLGRLLPDPRADRRRRHGRRRLRSLPPVCRGHRPDQGHGPGPLPLLHRLAADPSGRRRHAEPERNRLLRPPHRRPARGRASGRG